MATMFVTLQGNGGGGKSFLTAASAQRLVDRECLVPFIDTDTLNPTLLQCKPLKATHHLGPERGAATDRDADGPHAAQSGPSRGVGPGNATRTTPGPGLAADRDGQPLELDLGWDAVGNRGYGGPDPGRGGRAPVRGAVGKEGWRLWHGPAEATD